MARAAQEPVAAMADTFVTLMSPDDPGTPALLRTRRAHHRLPDKGDKTTRLPSSTSPRRRRRPAMTSCGNCSASTAGQCVPAIGCGSWPPPRSPTPRTRATTSLPCSGEGDQAGVGGRPDFRRPLDRRRARVPDRTGRRRTRAPPYPSIRSRQPHWLSGHNDAFRVNRTNGGHPI